MPYYGVVLDHDFGFLTGYVYFVDIDGNSLAVNTAGYRAVAGPLKDTLGNAVHIVVSMQRS